ncbi:MAG: NUDIX domain-containing protein [Patescibacteria group bacterium]
MKFQGPKSHIHSIARGLLVHGKKIILCRVRNAGYFFLPGGHIEDGESAREALLRELREEIGISDYKITSFVGVCENIFSLEDSISQHEINIIFKVDVPQEVQVDTKEDHIEFVSVAVDDLKDYKILPTALKNGLLEWLKDGKPFLKEI